MTFDDTPSDLAERLATLIEALPDAVFFKDGGGRWQVVNTAGLHLFGLVGEPWQGQSDLELGARYPALSEAFATCRRDDEAAWACGGRLDAVEYLPDPDSGELRTFDVTKVPLFEPDGGRRGLVIVGRDVTDRRRAEASEQRQRAALRHLGEIAAFSHQPLGDQFRQALAVGAAHLQLEFGIVSHIDGDRYTLVSQVSPPDTLVDGQLFPLGQTYCSITIEQDDVLAIAEMAKSPHHGHPCYQAFALETYIGAPIRVDGSVYGTVNFSSPTPYGRRFDDGDREFMHLLARWAGSAIERSRVEQRLAESELQLRTIIETEPECVKLLAADGRVLQMNRAGLAMLGADRPEQVLGMPADSCVTPPFRGAYNALTAQVFQGGSGRLEFEIRNLKGEQRWLETNAVPLRNASGEITSLLSVTRDISDRKRVESALRESEEKFRGMFELSPVGIALNDLGSGLFVDFNQALVELTGYGREELGRLSHRDLTPPEYAAEERRQHDLLLANGRYGPYEKEYLRRDGTRYPVLLNGMLIDDGAGRKRIWSFVQDISGRKAAEAEIHRLAFYDPLTQLGNRRLLLDRMGQAFAASDRRGGHGAVLFIDLDNFKLLNDTMGHNIGDRLLVGVARRLAACVRAEDTVARFGGDEFVVLLEGLSAQVAEAAVQAEATAEKVRTTLNQPYRLDGRLHHATPSIGVCLFQGHGEAAEDLFKHADVALYRAKAAGRNTVRFFDPSMQTALDTRAELEGALREALAQGQLQLHYQLQVDNRRRAGCVEALVRWLRPGHGLVLPGEFIPLAEETGLIVPLGHWVLEQACRQIKAWEASPATRRLRVAVNVSPRQFHQPDFVQEVRDLLAQSGTNPARLKLELTETLVLNDVPETVAKMRELKALGIGLSMDDFGTGFSSLAHLMHLPFEQIKIDQSFVRDLHANPATKTIVQAIITMAKGLGLDVIAEGVESERERDTLERIGCPTYQGFLFSRPLPLFEVERLLPAYLASS